MTDLDADYARGPGPAYPRGPVTAAYTATGAINRACPNCDAGEGEFCRQNGSQLQKIPCLKRLTPGDDK